MIVSIHIECDTAGELSAHLNKIIRTVKVRARQDPDYDFETGTYFWDNNCYGTHEVTIQGEQVNSKENN